MRGIVDQLEPMLAREALQRIDRAGKTVDMRRENRRRARCQRRREPRRVDRETLRFDIDEYRRASLPEHRTGRCYITEGRGQDLAGYVGRAQRELQRRGAVVHEPDV